MNAQIAKAGQPSTQAESRETRETALLSLSIAGGCFGVGLIGAAVNRISPGNNSLEVLMGVGCGYLLLALNSLRQSRGHSLKISAVRQSIDVSDSNLALALRSRSSRLPADSSGFSLGPRDDQNWDRTPAPLHRWDSISQLRTEVDSVYDETEQDQQILIPPLLNFSFDFRKLHESHEQSDPGN